MRCHVRERTKTFDSFGYEKYPPEQLNQREAEAIFSFQPIYNTSLPARSGYISMTALRKEMLDLKNGIRPRARSVRKCLIGNGIIPRMVFGVEVWPRDAAQTVVSNGAFA